MPLPVATVPREGFSGSLTVRVIQVACPTELPCRRLPPPAREREQTEVEVIRDNGDGWVKLRVLDSGRVGWMADFLLVASN